MAKKDISTKSFVLRVDGETMEALEKWAADEFRSINGQLQWIIAEALRKNGRLPKRQRKTNEPSKTAETNETNELAKTNKQNNTTKPNEQADK